jgi:serine/threonine protein kinase
MASIRNESVRSIAAASFKPSKEVAHQLRLALVAKELVVSLLDYSRGSDGKSPGKENGEFFMVMELGDISLEQYIEYRANNGKPFTVEEIRTILYDVTRMVCLLHSQGLAHLDVKPANIMLFNSTFWKIIDFDGCFRAASLVDVNQSDIAFTPLYCAPELAAVIVKMASQLKISRLMDVWSVGAIGAELVLLKPLFEARYSMMYDSQNNDDSEFLRWLCDLSQPVLAPRDSEKLMKVNDELRSLVEELLLVKDLKQRASLLEVLKHPFFGNMGPRQCWSVPAATNPHESSKARILTLNANELSIDPANPLESDDAGALVHDSSADDEEHNPGLSPAEITPMMSPQPKGRNTILRFVCCK